MNSHDFATNDTPPVKAGPVPPGKSRGGSFKTRPLVVVQVLAGYSLHFIANGLFVVCMLPLILLLAPFPAARHRYLQTLVRLYLTFYTRCVLTGLGVYKIAEISGLDRATARRPAIYVANHRSRLDALFLLGLLKHTGVVVKAKYAAAPAVGALVRHFDFVSTSSDSHSSTAGAVAKCRSLIESGKNLLVFPEGSRAASRKLQPFKSLAFRIAIECGCPVVPVIIHSTHPFLSRASGSLFPGGRNIYRIRFLEPESVLPSDTHEALADRIYRRIWRELKQLDRGTIWETL
ncbi:MAG: lysophospholipid acyltransferase family protein [bacterium]